MRTFTPAILASLAGRSGAGRAVVITRRDGAILRLIEAMTPKTIGGQTYVPGTGLIVGSIPFAANEQATSVDLDVVAVPGGVIDLGQIRAGIYRGARVDIYMINRLAASDGLSLLFSGVAGQITERGLGRITIEAVGPLARAAQLWAHKYSPNCRWLFGDGNCTIALAGLSSAGTVTASDGGYGVTLSGASGVDDYWTGGHLHVESGLMAGFDFEVRGWVAATGALTLYLPVAQYLSAGDVLTLYPGCTYQLAGAGGCSERWANAINFGGEPFMPGLNSLTSLGINSLGSSGTPSGTDPTGSSSGGGGGLQTIFSTAGDFIAFSDDHLTVSLGPRGGSENFNSALTNTYRTDGQYYFEITAINSRFPEDGSAPMAFGITAAGYNVNDGSMNDAMAVNNSGLITQYNTPTIAFPGVSNGTVISVAVNLNTGMIWFRTNGSAWNPRSDGTSGDPTTGTGGFDYLAVFPSWAGQPIYAGVGFCLEGQSAAGNFKTAFVYDLPVDYLPFGV